jgi:hypothetical protein
MNYGPKAVTSGLVLALDAADKNSYSGTGATWTDVSGTGNNGTLTNGPTFNTDNLGNILLDGTNDYVNVPYNVSFNPSSNLSFMIWTKLTVNDLSIRNPIELSAASDELYFILWRADLSPKRWGFGIRQSNNTYAETTSTSTNFSINTWYNIGLIANSSTGLVSLYINGVVDGSIAYNGTLKQNASATLAIGSDAANSRRYWQGNVSNVQIYNRALTATEMRQNYNATKGRFGL